MTSSDFRFSVLYPATVVEVMTEFRWISCFARPHNNTEASLDQRGADVEHRPGVLRVRHACVKPLLAVRHLKRWGVLAPPIAREQNGGRTGATGGGGGGEERGVMGGSGHKKRFIEIIVERKCGNRVIVATS
ncbi:hypothetical protein E2C01_016024 [Portunus trituberculatus]|uniref:Uncharacterized protein n=1 Tax=Portunus trituberculatus TaxID=210409 RepID=A0A5B7DN02_PORTR|nr:hypothetical protein [Portunus trituberculatus]